jgi:glyoxylase-like metal-dependent hydrolase (beta-lactamase superfamily II)
LAGERITDIILTHGHRDHSDGMNRLKTETGARTWSFGPIEAGGDPAKPNPAGADRANYVFIPDHVLTERDRVDGDGWSLEAVHTPGHAPDHLCFSLQPDRIGTGSLDIPPILFSGDHVMGWSTTVVAPPQGNMGAYIRSLEKLLERDETLYLPGHGGRIKDAKRVVKAYLVHRMWREAAIKQCLQNGQCTIDQILETLYRGIDAPLRRAAALSVFAHLEHLIGRGEVSALQEPASLTSTFSLL